MMTIDFTAQTKELIDNIKGICTSYGLGNDGNEYKIIIQSFLYKFLNDKFAYTAKLADNRLATAANWEEEVATYTDEEYKMLLFRMGGKCAKLEREHYLSYLYTKQNIGEFAKLFDDTLLAISSKNDKIFSIKAGDEGARIALFESFSNYVIDPTKRDSFCRAIINQLFEFSFEHIFDQKFDFFATIFEYMIKDYNKDGGGKYAEYYTPHAVAKIMAAILVDQPVRDVTCYDPSAGSGSLLMNLAHAIGEDRCTIYSQDISQKSSSLLRLNLILNNLIHSIQHVIQGNTLTEPYHKTGRELMKFDYIVSNPPFKLDFSEYQEALRATRHQSRFFAGVPKIPEKNKNGMSLYSMFLQHIMYSLAEGKGKAAVVVPTGFITAQTGIEKTIRQRMVDDRMLAGVVSMPSNIFATTGTNVSILFLDKGNKEGKIVLIDASKLGTTIKDGKNQKTLLSETDEQQIIDTFRKQEAKDDFSVVVSYDEIKEKNYSLSAGQYFEVKIEYIDITPEEFTEKMHTYTSNLNQLFTESRELEEEIMKQLGGVRYE